MLAKYPNPCCVCGEMFVPRETEIEQHPSMVGPRGGKKYAHAACLTRSNPRGRVRRNSGCGCGGYGCGDMPCGCGGGMYLNNPKGGQHREFMKLARKSAMSEQQMRSAAADQAIAEYQAERSGGGRRRF